MVRIVIVVAVTDSANDERMRLLYEQPIDRKDAQAAKKMGAQYTYSILRKSPFAFQIEIVHPARSNIASEIARSIQQRFRLVAAKSGLWTHEYEVTVNVE